VTRLQADWLQAPASRAVCGMLTDAGRQAWFVGGCVRNALIGAAVSDLDLATDATPQEVLELARAAGLKAVPTGFDHGTVTVIALGSPFEVTTFRRDVKTDGRHAVVMFSDRLEEDARRRDFTINALYAGPDGTVADPLGGLPDLMARRVRFIDDPHARIREDYLRILRFFRFHAWYGDPAGGIDAEGLAACADHVEGIAHLSRERVGQEIRKLLAAPDPAPATGAMAASGVLAQVLPGAGVTPLAILVHIEAGLGLSPDWLRRLAAVGGEDPAGRLRLSGAEAARLARLQDATGSAMAAGELGYRMGAAESLEVLALRAALGMHEIDPEQADLAQHGAMQRFPVRAADLMPRLQGPALGAALKRIEARWIASGFSLGRDQLLS
jgi:poly(A) polymerase